MIRLVLRLSLVCLAASAVGEVGTPIGCRLRGIDLRPVLVADAASSTPPLPAPRGLPVSSAASAAAPAAKLPPPVAPGMERNSATLAAPRALPRGIEIERPRARSLPADVEIEPAPNPSASSALNTKPLVEVRAAEPIPETPLDPVAARKLQLKEARARQMTNIIRWEEDMSARGSAGAMRALGYRYLHGDGVAKDEARGLEWLRKAADRGEVAAIKELAKREKANNAANKEK